MNAHTNPTYEITLSEKRTARTEPSRSNFNPGMPVVHVYENARPTPGYWYVDTIAESRNTRIAIDFGAGWELNENETALLKGFCIGILQAMIVEELR